MLRVKWCKGVTDEMKNERNLKICCSKRTLEFFFCAENYMFKFDAKNLGAEESNFVRVFRQSLNKPILFNTNICRSDVVYVKL